MVGFATYSGFRDLLLENPLRCFGLNLWSIIITMYKKISTRGRVTSDAYISAGNDYIETLKCALDSYKNNKHVERKIVAMVAT